MVKVSIIMGAYNCCDTIGEALDSLLSQTYTDWMAVICNDASTDGTKDILEEYCSKYPGKFLILNNKTNRGLNASLNYSLKYADCEYIARMDGDDISLPERLQMEVAYLDNHPDISIVSTPMIYFDEHGDWGRGTAIENPVMIDFIKGTPFCHAPCMVRRDAIMSVHGYSNRKWTMRAEDYDLWFRMYAKGHRGANLQIPLYKMRDDANAYHRRSWKNCFNEFCVRVHGFYILHLPAWSYIYAFRPLMVKLLPKTVYMYLHKKKQNK